MTTPKESPAVPRLYTPDQIDELPDTTSPLKVILEWAREYLARPHPDLGRDGPVCPFVPHSLDQNRLHICVIESDPEDRTEMERVVADCRSLFLSLDPKTGAESVTKTILVVFPRISCERAPALIDAIQAELKPVFVDDGLMLGQFHPENNEPGLWNHQFAPLRSPIPLLAIRFMVGGDIPFLKRDTDHIATRLRFLAGYVKACETYKWPSKWKKEARDALQDLIGKLEEWIAGEPPRR